MNDAGISLVVVGAFCGISIILLYLKFRNRWRSGTIENVKVQEKSLSLIGGLVKEKFSPIYNSYDLSSVVIGRGASGEVIVGKSKLTQRDYAVKIIDSTKKDVEWRYEREKNIMKDIDHTNVVRLFEVYKNESAQYFVMELCTGGHLGQVLRGKLDGRLELHTAKRYRYAMLCYY